MLLLLPSRFALRARRTAHGARDGRRRLLLLLLLLLLSLSACDTGVDRMGEVVRLDSVSRMVRVVRWARVFGIGSYGSAGVARDRDWSLGAPRGHAGRAQLASGTL